LYFFHTFKAMYAPPAQALSPLDIELPEKDRPIFLAAIQAGAAQLLTGDKQH
jgi:hypothetical protein